MNKKILFYFALSFVALVMSVAVTFLFYSLNFEKLNILMLVLVTALLTVPFLISWQKVLTNNLDLFNPILFFSVLIFIHFVIPMVLWDLFNIQFSIYKNIDINYVLIALVISYLSFSAGYYLIGNKISIIAERKALQESRIIIRIQPIVVCGLITVLLTFGIYLYRISLAGGVQRFLLLLQNKLVAFQGQGYLLATKDLPVPVLLLSLLALFQRKHNPLVYKFWVAFLFVAMAVSLYFGGGRASLIDAMIMILVIWNYRKNKIQYRHMVLFFLIAVAFSFYYLIVVRGAIDGSRYNITKTEDVGQLVLTSISKGDFTEAFILGDVLTKVPGQFNFQQGKSFLALLTFPMPRVLFPEKLPEAGSLWTQMVYPDISMQTSLGMPAIGELYLNFGWIGIIIGMSILGVLSRFFYSFCRNNKNDLWVFMYGLFIYWFYFYFTRSFVLATYQLLILWFFGYVCYRLVVGKLSQKNNLAESFNLINGVTS